MTVTRRFRVVPALAVCGVALVAAACSSSPSPSSTPAPSATVTIMNLSFGPATVTIHAGQAVEWKWDDGPTPSNVTGGGFASPTQTTGTFVHVFDTPGVYPYRSTVRVGQVGTVVVLP